MSGKRERSTTDISTCEGDIRALAECRSLVQCYLIQVISNFNAQSVRRIYSWRKDLRACIALPAPSLNVSFAVLYFSIALSLTDSWHRCL